MNDTYEICSQAEMAKLRDSLYKAMEERVKYSVLPRIPDEERPMKIKIEEIPNEQL